MSYTPLSGDPCSAVERVLVGLFIIIIQMKRNLIIFLNAYSKKKYCKVFEGEIKKNIPLHVIFCVPRGLLAYDRVLKAEKYGPWIDRPPAAIETRVQAHPLINYVANTEPDHKFRGEHFWRFITKNLYVRSGPLGKVTTCGLEKRDAKLYLR